MCLLMCVCVCVHAHVYTYIYVEVCCVCMCTSTGPCTHMYTLLVIDSDLHTCPAFQKPLVCVHFVSSCNVSPLEIGFGCHDCKATVL